MCVYVWYDERGRTSVYIWEERVYFLEIKKERQRMLGNGLHLYTIFSEPPQSMKSLSLKSVHWSSFESTNFFLHICLSDLYCQHTLSLLPSFLYRGLSGFSLHNINQTRKSFLLSCSFPLPFSYHSSLKNSAFTACLTPLLSPVLSVQVCRSHRWPMDTATVGGTSSGSRWEGSYSRHSRSRYWTASLTDSHPVQSSPALTSMWALILAR